jgi:hypothetical protein
MAEVWTPPAFDDIATTELVTAAYLNQLGNSLRFLKEVDYVQITSDVTISATTQAGANTIVTGTSRAYEAVPHLIEFFAARVMAGISSNTVINLWDGSTDLGRLAQISNAATGATGGGTISAATRITPTAATHQYIIKGWRDSANGTVNAASGTWLPAFIRITRVPT